jgi:hypothetical protein
MPYPVPAETEELLSAILVDGRPFTEILGGLTADDREDVAGWFIDRLDQSRLEQSGGYPSTWLVLRTELADETLVMATMDPAKEYNAPELVVRPLVDWLVEHEEWIFDLLGDSGPKP